MLACDYCLVAVYAETWAAVECLFDSEFCVVVMLNLCYDVLAYFLGKDPFRDTETCTSGNERYGCLFAPIVVFKKIIVTKKSALVPHNFHLVSLFGRPRFERLRNRMSAHEIQWRQKIKKHVFREC